MFFRWTRQGTEKNLHEMGQQTSDQGMCHRIVWVHFTQSSKREKQWGLIFTDRFFKEKTHELLIKLKIIIIHINNLLISQFFATHQINNAGIVDE